MGCQYVYCMRALLLRVVHGLSLYLLHAGPTTRTQMKHCFCHVFFSIILSPPKPWCHHQNRYCYFVPTKSTTFSFYTPGSGEHGPRFLTGGPGAAPGGVASKNGWMYMRVQGGFDLHSRVCPSVGMCVCRKTAVCVENWLRERLRVCRGGSRNQLRGLKEGGSARRGAMLCLPADLTSHARFNFSPCSPCRV